MEPNLIIVTKVFEVSENGEKILIEELAEFVEKSEESLLIKKINQKD